MTHKPPQGIDAALSYCARCNCRRYRNVEGKCEVCALYQAQRAAPLDPRTDFAALEELAKEIEMHCPCGARPESLNTHAHVPGCKVEALVQRLAEMRGAKR